MTSWIRNNRGFLLFLLCLGVFRTAIADWNPMSAIASSCRSLFAGANPAATIQAWPMQHPELAVLAWSVALIAIFAPTAVYLFRRKVLR